MNWETQRDTPLYEDILWSRPERAEQAGKLLIIGGNQESMAAPLEAYTVAEDAGIGSVVVALPDVFDKQLKLVPDILFCPSNPSGGFGAESLSPLLNASANATGVLLAGSTANNSETSQLLEELVVKIDKPTVITGDSLTLLLRDKSLETKSAHCYIMNPGQLQKFVSNSASTKPYTHDMTLPALVELLLALESKAHIVALHAGALWVCSKGKVSMTKRPDLDGEHIWQAGIAARASVFLLQNESTPYQALTTAVFNPQNIV